MNASIICRILEITRWVTVVVGFQAAFLWGVDPPHKFHILMPWVVGALAGLTGIESLFFGRAAAEQTGYAPSAYQRQSGMNNLALGITALLVWGLGWGTYAEASVMTVLLIFLTLSAGNHAWSAWREGNTGIKNLLRPVMTVLLIAFVLLLMISAVTFSE